VVRAEKRRLKGDKQAIRPWHAGVLWAWMTAARCEISMGGRVAGPHRGTGRRGLGRYRGTEAEAVWRRGARSTVAADKTKTLITETLLHTSIGGGAWTQRRWRHAEVAPRRLCARGAMRTCMHSNLPSQQTRRTQFW
jgi:hypothetical protein